jgi:cell wall-associated NlpC family hydrolase
MWGNGQKVDRGNLRPGDLVFFKNTYRSGISHVGVYVGDGRFVHAVRPGKSVQVSDLTECYYSAHWAGAYRIVD